MNKVNAIVVILICITLVILSLSEEVSVPYHWFKLCLPAFLIGWTIPELFKEA